MHTQLCVLYWCLYNNIQYSNSLLSSFHDQPGAGNQTTDSTTEDVEKPTVVTDATTDVGYSTTTTTTTKAPDGNIFVLFLVKDIFPPWLSSYLVHSSTIKIICKYIISF